MTDSHVGRCFCNAVEFEVRGQPAVVGYCHCDDCKNWLAAPVNAFTLWPRENVRLVRGEVKTFNRTEAAYRKFCATCGGPVMTDHPSMGLVDVYAILLEDFTHEPTMHVHYGRRFMALRDGLPKFKDLPAEFGGSGETLPE